MLVVTRKKNETIRISDNVEILVVGIEGEKVRIGVTAPDDVPVHRGEVYETILAANGVVNSGVRNVAQQVDDEAAEEF